MSTLQIPPPEVIRAGLRALMTVARADGKIADLERSLIESVQRHILHSDLDAEELPSITPEQLAEAVSEAEFRKRIVYGCILMTLIDEDPAQAELDVVDTFASTLGVEDKSLKSLHTFAEGKFKVLRFDLMRRFIAKDRLAMEWDKRGFAGIVRLAKQALLSEDQATAQKYTALEALPDGTLGKEYWRFMRANGFGFPGEKGSPPDIMVFHDCNHVLAGYSTDPVGETQIAAFHAGYRQEDPMGMLLFALSQFHLGVQITPVDPSHHGMVQPELLLKAFARGRELTQDLTTTWDPHEDFETPVLELRERFGVPPL